MIQRNILFNYISQGYAALIGVVVLPWYFKIMGAEAYGLIGFFTLLQSLFSLLDLGLTSTMTRQSARLTGGGISESEYVSLFGLLRIFFITIGIAGALLMSLNSELVASSWLNNVLLDDDLVSQCIVLMSVGLGLRWVSGLYRGIVSGFERQVWLSKFNILIATFRFILPIPLLLIIDSSPLVYFAFQIAVALLEVCVLMYFVGSLMPKVDDVGKPGMAAIKPHLNFSLKIAFLSVIWVLVTQIDKLVLSKTLSLKDYGYFSLGVMAASVILFFSGPVGTALLPRMTALHAANDTDSYYEMYSRYTRMVASLVFPAALMLMFFSKEILLLWTADADLSARVAPVLSLYALGNAFLALSAFPYYLQYSNGDMRLHVYGNLIFLFMVVPAIAYGSVRYGMSGAAWVWLTVNVLYFLLWVPLVHRHHYPHRHIPWLVKDCLTPMFLAALVLLVARAVLNFDIGPVWAMLQLALAGVLALVATPFGRNLVRTDRLGVAP